MNWLRRLFGIKPPKKTDHAVAIQEAKRFSDELLWHAHQEMEAALKTLKDMK